MFSHAGLTADCVVYLAGLNQQITAQANRKKKNRVPVLSSAQQREEETPSNLALQLSGFNSTTDPAKSSRSISMRLIHLTLPRVSFQIYLHLKKTIDLYEYWWIITSVRGLGNRSSANWWRQSSQWPMLEVVSHCSRQVRWTVARLPEHSQGDSSSPQDWSSWQILQNSSSRQTLLHERQRFSELDLSLFSISEFIHQWQRATRGKNAFAIYRYKKIYMQTN